MSFFNPGQNTVQLLPIIYHLCGIFYFRWLLVSSEWVGKGGKWNCQSSEAALPGFEPRTPWSPVLRPNHWATAPPQRRFSVSQSPFPQVEYSAMRTQDTSLETCEWNQSHWKVVANCALCQIIIPFNAFKMWLFIPVLWVIAYDTACH